MIISMDAELVVDNTQHSFMTITVSQLQKKGTSLI